MLSVTLVTRFVTLAPVRVHALPAHLELTSLVPLVFLMLLLDTPS